MQVDFSALNAQLETLSANVGKLAGVISAPTDAEQRIAQLEADLTASQANAAQLQADLDASQAAEAAIAGQFKAQNDAIAALLPPAA
jgi:uncharacterized protein involved in exopolysaccharide biosynthesis